MDDLDFLLEIVYLFKTMDEKRDGVIGCLLVVSTNKLENSKIHKPSLLSHFVLVRMRLYEIGLGDEEVCLGGRLLHVLLGCN